MGHPVPPPHAAFNEPVHLLDGLEEVMVCLEAQEMPWFKGGQPRGPGGFKEGRDALDQASSLADAGDPQGQPRLARGAAVQRDSRAVQVWLAWKTGSRRM